jgi:hypothetical protein
MQKDKGAGQTGNVKGRGCRESNDRHLPFAPSQPSTQPVITIDDLEVLAVQLLAHIQILKTYKYPLSVRRGVKTH